MDGVRIGEVPLLDQDVLGQVHVHRPRAAAPGEEERFLDGAGEVVAVLHQEVVLGGGAGDSDIVGFLEGVVPDEVRGHLAGEGDERDRVHERVLERGHQIGGGGPGGHQADADPAGGAGVSLGRVAGGRLLADQDMTDSLEVVQDVVNRQHCAAR